MSHFLDKRVHIVVVLFLLLTAAASAQLSPKESRKLFFKADKAFENGDYLGAMSMYQQLYPADSNNSELNFKLGICHYEIKKYRKQSKKYFQKVVLSEFEEANYYLGRLYHLERDFEKAIACMTQYKYMSTGEEHSKKEIDELIAKSNTALLMESNTDKTLQIKNLGPEVNSEYAEYAPLIPAQ